MREKWTENFLAALQLSPNVAAACREAGISRQAAYERRKADQEFSRAWDDAIEESTDELVGEMYRRAIRGVDRQVLYRGEPVLGVNGQPLVETHYSDTLAIFLAKAHRPHIYADRLQAEHSGDLTIRVEYADADSDIEPPAAPSGPGEDPAGGEAV
ncbi:MAG TPA: hypothetical protein VN719_09395 [Gemmatimonadales bacterium]|nr:hypothetical protein [Gemmatimonadales bacterium]